MEKKLNKSSILSVPSSSHPTTTIKAATTSVGGEATETKIHTLTNPHIMIENNVMCTPHALHDTAIFASCIPFNMTHNNKIKLKKFIFKLFLTLLFIAHFLFEFNICQYKIFTNPTITKHSSQHVYKALYMHDSSKLHAATPSLLSLSLISLVTAHFTQHCTSTVSQKFTDPTLVPRINIYSFGHRLSSRP